MGGTRIFRVLKGGRSGTSFFYWVKGWGTSFLKVQEEGPEFFFKDLGGWRVISCIVHRDIQGSKFSD